VGVELKQSLQAIACLVFFVFSCDLEQVRVLAKTKKPCTFVQGFVLSGWQDSNLRPPAPKAGAITGLRYTPRSADADKFQ
jgi:hypothetical protein